MRKFILNEERIPIAVEDVIEWARWFEKASNDRSRVVQQDRIWPGVFISTVFLGLDHNFPLFGDPDHPPLIFETMIFGGTYDEWQDRCSTWEQAETIHRKALDMVLAQHPAIRLAVWLWRRIKSSLRILVNSIKTVISR